VNSNLQLCKFIQLTANHDSGTLTETRVDLVICRKKF